MLVDFDDLQQLEHARSAAEAEEGQRAQERERAERTLCLESVAQARLAPQPGEDDEEEADDAAKLKREALVPGVLLMVECEESSNAGRKARRFFTDAVNHALRSFNKACQDMAEAGSGSCSSDLAVRFDAIVAFLALLLLHRFHRAAASCCEELASLLCGFGPLMQQGVAQRAWPAIDETLRVTLARLRRLVLLAVVREAAAKAACAAQYGAVAQVVLPGAPAHVLCRWLTEDGPPPGDPSEEIEISLSFASPPGSSHRRLASIDESWTAELLRGKLVDLGLPSTIELWECRRHGECPQPISPEAKLRSLAAGAVVEVRGVIVDCAFTDVKAIIRGDTCLARHLAWAAWWRQQAAGGATSQQVAKHAEWRLVRSSVVTATRLLHELRDRFSNAAFLKQYWELKAKAKPGTEAHTDFIALTFDVQSEVLPKYGFEASPRGVYEMRESMRMYGGLNVWEFEPASATLPSDEVIWKIRRDIHMVLDMGQHLPRLQLGGGSRYWSWLRWARLVAKSDAACAQGAQLIADSDVLLLCTGAGFSADSGLAVYADVARLAPYAARNLEYKDLCSLRLLRKDPELFWGFWGQCYNDYRDTSPHEGYEIINRWAECRFRRSSTAQMLRDAAANAEAASPSTEEAVPDAETPGAFFAFTSNVDAHHYDWFRATEIRECHGNTELYQCAAADGPRCDDVWPTPQHFRFCIDKKTMLAPRWPVAERPQLNERKGRDADDPQRLQEDFVAAAPRVGLVRGGGRPRALANFPRPSVEAALAAERSFASNHPSCPACGAAGRPGVLLFEDGAFRGNQSQAARWRAWTEAVKARAAERARGREGSLRVVILELGAGGSVTTVRSTAEQQLLGLRAAGAAARLVRVNPELPLGDDPRLAPGGDLEDLVLSVMTTALEALRKMDEAMPAEMRR